MPEKQVSKRSLLKMLGLLLSHKKEDKTTASTFFRENPGLRTAAQKLIKEISAKKAMEEPLPKLKPRKKRMPKRLPPRRRLRA